MQAANSVCTPSRAAILTGRLPVRSGMTGTLALVMHSPQQATGLPETELTLAEALAPTYVSAAVGKWHLGIHSNVSGPGLPLFAQDAAFLPLNHGFSSYYGFPFTNNPGCHPNATHGADPLECFLMRDTTVVEQPLNLETLPDRLTDEAIGVIRRYAGVQPFFLYYAFVQPHAPVFASPAFRGKSKRGLYGDAVEEIDSAVGRVMDALADAGQADNTLVFFTSDNGAWNEMRLEGGSNGLLRGGKAQDWEGGVRVPGIAWGPGLGVRQGARSMALVSTMDMFSTALDFAGIALEPPVPVLDGRSIRAILTGEEPDDATALTRVLYHYCGYNLHAMRYGPWKAHFATPRLSDPVTATCTYQFLPDRIPGITGCSCMADLNNLHSPPLLFHLDTDPSELYPVDPDSDPAAAAALAFILEVRARHEAELVPGPTMVDTPAVPELQPCCSPPACFCIEGEAETRIGAGLL